MLPIEAMLIFQTDMFMDDDRKMAVSATACAAKLRTGTVLR